MNKEQVKDIARDCGLVVGQHWNRSNMITAFMLDFANAAIESYKAELLNEVGEPVLYAEFAEDGGWLGDASEYADHLEEPHALFTSYQVAAAIESYKAELLKEVGEPVAEFKRHPFGDYTELSFSAGYSARRGDKLYTSDRVAAAIAKATKPLEERRCEICGYAEHHREHTGCLRTQLAAAQEEIERLRSVVFAAESLDKAELGFQVKQLTDQLAAAQEEIESNKAYFTTLLEEQRVLLAKAEQRVAEACAELADKMNPFPEPSAIGPEIRSGEWRKLLKEGE